MRNIAISQITEAKETYLALLELSRLIHTELDPESLTLCVRLCEAGVNPEALSACITELSKQVANIENSTDREDVTNKNR